MSTATDPLATQANFSTKEPFVGLYTMYYRQGALGNHLIGKNFRFNGSLKEARERAELHCNIIGAKLNWVQPLISDLKKEEDAHLGKGIGVEV